MNDSETKELEEITKLYDSDRAKYRELSSKFFAKLDQKKEKERALNPTDAPNTVLKNAILQGILLYNDEILEVGKAVDFLKIKDETLKIWTYKDFEYSLIISQVDPEVKQQDLWKTAGSILELAVAIYSQLESIPKIEYDWIFRFDPTVDLGDQHMLEEELAIGMMRSIFKITDISKLMQHIDLLSRDDKYFVAAQNIVISKVNHEFCQICAITPEHHRHHENPEFKFWNRINKIPYMETSIVQATRSVEAILGKPGDKKNAGKLFKFKQKWKDILMINPDDRFEVANKSFVDYYYDLFEIRGTSAHSLGNLSFSLQRQQAITAQSFAWVITRDYFFKNALSYSEAAEKLSLNVDLVSRVPDDYSTTKTKKI